MRAMTVSTENRPRGCARVEEVARFLGISRSKLYAMMDSGDLAYVKLGKSRRVRWEDVDKLVQDSLVQG